MTRTCKRGQFGDGPDLRGVTAPMIISDCAYKLLMTQRDGDRFFPPPPFRSVAVKRGSSPTLGG